MNARAGIARMRVEREESRLERKNLFRKTEFSVMETPKKLCGSLWAQNEFALLFAEDGAGKSIFSVQTGCNIAKGERGHESFINEVDPQPVAYIDAELSDFQFYNRYKEPLPSNFNRFAFDEASALIKADLQFVIKQIEEAAISCGAKVIILDNLSALCSMADLTKTQDSIDLMGLLNELKKKGYSILVIDHSRKPMTPGDFKIISKHDLQGSKMKSNLADSVFALGKSCQNEKLRYIKGLKIRSFERPFRYNGVATVEIMQNPLRLEYVGMNEEFEHVNTRKAEVFEMASQGITQAQIAEKIGVTQQAVSKMLKPQ